MEKYRIPLDTYDMKPKGMLAYLRYNGWHFNKGLCEWAIRQMRSMNKTTAKLERIDPIEKDTVMELLKANSITKETKEVKNTFPWLSITSFFIVLIVILLLPKLLRLK